MGISKISAQLKKAALKRLAVPGYVSTDIPGFYMNRVDDAARSEKCFYRPKVILMVQGSKRAVVGSEETVYRENQCLVPGIDVPGTSYVVEASPQKPLITMSVDLDIGAISQMISEMPLEKISGDGLCRGLAVSDADEGMMGAFLRLVELLDRKDEIPVLAPITIREIYSRLLISPMGRHVREFCTIGTQSNQISRAVKWLKENFSRPFRIEDLARYVNMAPTTFHRHFREPHTVPEESEAARGQEADDCRKRNRGARRLRGRLRKPHAVQQGIQAALRHFSQAGRVGLGMRAECERASGPRAVSAGAEYLDRRARAQRAYRQGELARA